MNIPSSVEFTIESFGRGLQSVGLRLGQVVLHEARRLKELERENAELKKMLAEALLAKRVELTTSYPNQQDGETPRQWK